MAGPVNPVVNRNLSMAGNDDRHDQRDPNRGGSPTLKSRKKVAPAQRGGFGHQGQRVHVRAAMPGGRPGAGNPADRGSVRPVGRQSFTPEQRNPNKGGGVQVRTPGLGPARGGGFGAQPNGKDGTVSDYGHANPPMTAGNTSGRMATRITGRFNNKSKGVGGNTGKYGGPPVRLDT